ncbi:MAG: hypothetical protein P1V18_05140 [Candidatus Gracilibacteria bacterium]|nr:hypothetical protein [Candidatus Gracilibacteria bacterium]
MKHYCLYRFLFLFLGFFLLAQPAFAQVDLTDFVPDEEGAATGSFTLDQDGTAGSGDVVQIEFGSVLNEYLQFDVDDGRFELSDDLSLEGNELENFRVENAAADPTCDAPSEGRMYYNTTDDELRVCSNLSWSVVGSGGGGSVDQTNIVYVDGTRSVQTGEVYGNLADAIVYINTQSPGPSNPWVIIIEPGSNNETVTIPASTLLLGRDRTKTTFSGVITMSSNSAVQNVTIDDGGAGGELYVPGATSAFVTDSDVELGDGAGGGNDGTVSVVGSFLDGDNDASGLITATNSVVGLTSFINAGTLGTYNSSVFNLTDTGSWMNFGVAYDNNNIAAANQLDAEDTQDAIDELILGTPADSFTLDENQGGAQDVTLEFGNVVGETLQWDEINDYFSLSDALVVDGNVNLQGTILRLDSDEAGNPDQDIEIIASQGSENSGVLRYDDDNDRWELSNDGGAFEAILTGDGMDTPDRFHAVHNGNQSISGSGFSAVTGWTAPETISSGSFTFNATTGELTVNQDGWYMVSVHGGVENTGTGEGGAIRSTAGWRMTENTGSGFTLIPGSLFATYSREQFSGQTQGSVSFPREYSLGDIIRLEVENIDGGAMQTESGATALALFSLEGVTGPAGAQGLPGSVGLGTNETSFTIDQDEGGDPDQDVDIIAEQGSESNGILRYDDGNNRWEFSNDGGSTFKALSGGSGACGDNAVFWGERGTVVSDQSWALGNGQTPFGSIMGCPGNVRQIAATCTGTIGTSLSAVLRKNNVATSCSVNLSTTVGQATINSCSETFLSTDVLGVYAGTETGTWTECVGTFWVDYD